MAKYLLVDTANTFFRSRHVVRGDLYDKLGMSIHITLSAISKAFRDFKCDHTIICLEGRSWRKDYMTHYKKNREEARRALTQAKLEEDEAFWNIYDELTSFLKDSTNSTVMRHANLEADDLIAGWIQTHPDDEHVILSTDGDFKQLIASNVSIYNGVNNHTITAHGIFDDRGRPVNDKKTGEPKPAPNPEWLLFEKCMRGDASDNVFSAYPGVRTRGTKNKVGLMEAFADKNNKGFAWNNLMLQRWTDHNGEEHRVIDCYNKNVMMCDLTAQPESVRHEIVETIRAVGSKQVPQVGTRLLKFCAKHELTNLSDRATTVAESLSTPLPIQET